MFNSFKRKRPPTDPDKFKGGPHVLLFYNEAAGMWDQAETQGTDYLAWSPALKKNVPVVLVPKNGWGRSA